jgi:hypothetical protein
VPKTPRNICVFRGAFIREQVDPRVKTMWLAKTGKQPPFGDLRRIWRQRHCNEVNPYGSETCPYTEADCSLAFLQSVEVSLARSTSNPVGYFRRVARSNGERRAETKPLLRDLRHTDNSDVVRRRMDEVGDSHGASQDPIMDGNAQGPGDPRSSPSGPAEGPGDVPRPITRPVPIGDLLGALDLRPRPGPRDDGEAGTQ